MGSKETMVIAPIIVLLYDRVFLANSWAEVWKKRSVLYAGLAATWLILILLVIVNNARGGGLLGSPAVSWWRYAKNQFGAIAHYLRLTFWPDTLCLDYGWQVSPLPTSWKAIGVVLAVALISATGWALANAPSVGFLGAWFFLTLAPSSSVVPIQDMVAERRMYLPLAAVVTLTVLAAWNGLSALSRRFKLTPTALGWPFFALIAGALAWRTAQRNHDYQSGIAIWTDTIRQRPQNGRAWTNLASSYYKAGRFDSAVACFQRAIELLPVSKDAINGAILVERLARIYAQVADTSRALDFLESATKLPNGLNYGALKLEQDWDRLRGDPRFEKIVASLAPK